VKPIPAPVPTAGTGADWKASFVHLCFVGVWPHGSIPDFGRFPAHTAALIFQRYDTIPIVWRDVYVADGTLGKGLFAARKFSKGEKIGTFEGPVIDFATAVEKGEKQCYPLQIAHNKYVDLIEPGCYANHSCDPNAGIRDDIDLVAIADISPNAEIRYDYSTTMDEDFFTMPCRCGSSICRGIVTDFKFINLALQNKYIKHGQVMSFILNKLKHS
jgi:uncharacterized protein